MSIVEINPHSIRQGVYESFVVFRQPILATLSWTICKACSGTIPILYPIDLYAMICLKCSVFLPASSTV